MTPKSVIGSVVLATVVSLAVCGGSSAAYAGAWGVSAGYSSGGYYVPANYPATFVYPRCAPVVYPVACPPPVYYAPAPVVYAPPVYYPPAYYAPVVRSSFYVGGGFAYGHREYRHYSPCAPRVSHYSYAPWGGHNYYPSRGGHGSYGGGHGSYRGPSHGGGYRGHR
jgi:hypothetical protein